MTMTRFDLENQVIQKRQAQAQESIAKTLIGIGLALTAMMTDEQAAKALALAKGLDGDD